MRALSSGGRALVVGSNGLAEAPAGTNCPCCDGEPPPTGECCNRECDPPEGSGTCGKIVPDDPSVRKFGYANWLFRVRRDAFSRVRYRYLRTIFGPPPQCTGEFVFERIRETSERFEEGQANASSQACDVAVLIPVEGNESSEVRLGLNPTPCTGCSPQVQINRTEQPILYCLLARSYCWSIVPGCQPLRPFGDPRENEVRTLSIGGFYGDVEEVTTVRYEQTPNRWSGFVNIRRTKLPATPTTATILVECSNGLGQPPSFHEYEVSVGANDVSFVETVQIRSLITHDWSHQCTNEPTGFTPPQPLPNPCVGGPTPPPPPPPVRYVKGQPCPGNQPAPSVVTDIRNVIGCGVVLVRGYCYKFDPAGPILAEAPPDAIVSDLLVQPGETCCSCLSQINPRCSTVQVDQRAEWLTGFRGIDDRWQLSTGFSNGRCCCSPRDKFFLVAARSYVVRQFNPDGTEAVADETIFEPYIFTDTPRVEVLRGFPREPLPNEPLEFGWTVRKRLWLNGVVDPQFDQVSLGVAPREAIGCEWLAGFFTVPLRNLPGLIDPGPFNPFPIPFEADADGFVGDTAINRYDVLANCDILTARGEWAFRPGRGPVVEQTAWAEMVWRIERDADSPCSGGCTADSSTPPPLPLSAIEGVSRSTLPAEVMMALGGGQGLSAGCGSCGGDGGL